MAQVMPPKPVANLPALAENKILPLTPPGDSSPWQRLDNSFTFYPDSPPLSSPSPGTDDLDQSLCQSVKVSQNDEPVIAVVGVGYVGTHLVSSFSSKYQVIGFDVSAKRIKDLGVEYQGQENVHFSRESQDLQRATHFLISVPTLLRPDKTIDSSYLRDALKTRVDPGRAEPPVQSIPKIISGLDDITPGSLDAIIRVYSTIFETVVPVSKPEVAETMKLYENCQRMVCIAYANEMADACIPHGINSYEVCEAASTKPFEYMPYSPSVGVGGHCIPVNPFYLLSNSRFPLLECATLAMHSRPSRLAERVLKRLRQRVTGRTPRVLVVGMGFKAGQSQIDNSPGADLVKSLAVSREVDVCWADSLVKQSALPQVRRLLDEDWRKDVLRKFDIIVVASRQTDMSFDILNELDGVEIERWCQ
ncbi:hypothetical protein FANTH_174 [Fusarium anthophilum]|uniref:UDP-glucose/GDP-mannose dehydrogenase dimerisation domain-containing protein n=1 Tax=Fusarium anthophilum TaxID=48485 RepID=A0A8H4ZYN4_9HYPO|nr:hypothetical protein FANTH_174 [Fusarium anthophilum]